MKKLKKGILWNIRGSTWSTTVQRGIYVNPREPRNTAKKIITSQSGNDNGRLFFKIFEI